MTLFPCALGVAACDDTAPITQVSTVWVTCLWDQQPTFDRVLGPLGGSFVFQGTSTR